MVEVTDNMNTLLKQAGITADVYLGHGISYIDDHFGKGYAEKHPELLGAFIQAAARDFHTALIVKTMNESSSKISYAIECLIDPDSSIGGALYRLANEVENFAAIYDRHESNHV